MNIIDLKNISKTYTMGALEVPVLHDISLAIEQGEFVVIMGHSGSGKSTLLHILGLLDKPTSGSYFLDGEAVSAMSDDKLAALRNRLIGYIFQQFNLLARMSTKENVSLPLIYAAGNAEHSSETELLNQVGLSDRTLHRPNELSGGQQQRVAVARALINNPLLIFADEPTGNLDTRSTAEIIQILKKLNDAGITVIMVTHEPELAQVATRVLKLEDGRIIMDEKRRQNPAAGRPRPLDARGHPAVNLVRIKDYFIQAMRALVSNKTRSVLSILGVQIGVASLIAMMALGTGAQEAVQKSISSLGSNLLMVRSSGSRGGISLGSAAPTRFTLQDVDAVKTRVMGVARVAPYANSKAQIIYNGKNWNTSVNGTSADYPALHNSRPAQGRFFTDQETTARARVALIGKTVQKNLFDDGTSPIGRFIKINRLDFRIIGLLPEKGSSGFRDEDDQVIIPVNTAMYRLFGKQFIDYMDVQIATAEQMDAAGDQIQDLLIAMHRLPESKRDTIDIRNMADIQEAISTTTKTFSSLLGSIAFISLLVGGIGIMNIMLVSVSERTREIGLRKAIGANNKDILFQFVIESVTVCVVGGVMGILLGSGISLLLARFAGWSTQIAPSGIVLSFTFSVLIGLVFGVWPARKASQLNPIDALRYE